MKTGNWDAFLEYAYKQFMTRLLTLKLVFFVAVFIVCMYCSNSGLSLCQPAGLARKTRVSYLGLAVLQRGQQGQKCNLTPKSR